MTILWYFNENKTLLSSGREPGKNPNIYGENVLFHEIHSI